MNEVPRFGLSLCVQDSKGGHAHGILLPESVVVTSEGVGLEASLVIESKEDAELISLALGAFRAEDGKFGREHSGSSSFFSGSASPSYRAGWDRIFGADYNPDDN